MGRGDGWKCPECGYTFDADTGIGFMYPMVYAETIEAAKRGALGDALKELLDTYPDAAINPETVILQCSDCGNYDARPLLTSYIPKKNVQKSSEENSKRWSVAFPFEGASYVTSEDMKEYYNLYAEYDHKCKECGGRMNVITPSYCDQGSKMICPMCKEPLELVSIIFWD